MIPKIIHYCWFGKQNLPEDIKRYIDTWKEKCQDYTFMQWNESNFDINSNKFVKHAYENKKMAFVSDYVRLKALYDYGGIYLDTDVEVLRSFDDLLNNKTFLCAESEYSICSAVIGSEKNSFFIKRLMSMYDDRSFIDVNKENAKPNSRIIFDLINKEDGYRYNNKMFKTEDYTIYPSYYFSPINCYTYKSNIRKDTYCVHYYARTWKTKSEKTKDIILALITRILGEGRREKIKQTLNRIREN